MIPSFNLAHRSAMIQWIIYRFMYQKSFDKSWSMKRSCLTFLFVNHVLLFFTFTCTETCQLTIIFQTCAWRPIIIIQAYWWKKKMFPFLQLVIIYKTWSMDERLCCTRHETREFKNFFIFAVATLFYIELKITFRA